MIPKSYLYNQSYLGIYSLSKASYIKLTSVSVVVRECDVI